jgi:hypothetical protein
MNADKKSNVERYREGEHDRVQAVRTRHGSAVDLGREGAGSVGRKTLWPQIRLRTRTQIDADKKSNVERYRAREHDRIRTTSTSPSSNTP